MEEPQKNYLNTMDLENDEPLKSTGPQISVSEFSCHCCYDILVNPTTLNCGHSFCRHCLALWWASSKKTECPECREKWEGFPKVNILLRLLLTLTEEEFSKTPYTIENSSHRRAILMELERVKALGVKPPQNLWEYKAVNPGRSLFLLYALKSSPRLSLLYLYLFDYTDTFLPFIHTICPLQEDSSGEDIVTKLLDLKEPTWKQWREFLVKYSFLPYQLIAEFAWDWLEVHYWTSRFLIINAMLLSVLELFSFWRIWSRSELKTVPQRMWSHFWKVSTQGLFVAMFWPLIPQFVCNCLFYWALYFNPIINIDLVVKELRRLETQVL
ncbi:bifunctional apoptosis regulator isoform X2 [Nomascus leucogenys]|uniref:Bifunctional apoptosis regulator n=1 Tax=Nomascus leucogenys TaxID=61853 RepID=A0A2I3H6N4_NOMLE|nr:bifunctional apoptosis regulator isoform X2 [Nomascus leucogenys]